MSDFPEVRVQIILNIKSLLETEPVGTKGRRHIKLSINTDADMTKHNFISR